jgi:(p)ppGpp synthase/HD superfamily hydrolase
MTLLTPPQQLLLAAQVCARAHKNQKRADGTPYAAHPVRVAFRIAMSDYTTTNLPLSPNDKIRAQIVALLHDVVEDTPVGFNELRELGFEQTVVEAVDSVTKRPGEKYSDFTLRAKQNAIGRVVKLADIADNTEDQSALDPEEAEYLTVKYEKARKVLLDV